MQSPAEKAKIKVTVEDKLVSEQLGVTNVDEVVKESSKVTQVSDDLDLEQASEFDFLAYLEQ